MKMLLLLSTLLINRPVFAYQERGTSEPTPLQITYCDLAKDPAAYNHKAIRITSFVAHGFENFSLGDPSCKAEDFSVWVMYGGRAQSGTMYCCPGEGGATARQKPLEVEGVSLPLAEDANFRQFTALLGREPDTIVHLTAIGTFFSGEKRIVDGRTTWGGAGHLGCCSLFVVQKIESFQPHTRKDLDYSAEAGWHEKEGCKPRSVKVRREVSIEGNDETSLAIEMQKQADQGEAAWMYSDPKRAAEEALSQIYPGEKAQLRNVKQHAARQVFRWQKGKERVLVVLTRPYWLSLFATSDSVVWVPTMIKEVTCDWTASLLR